MACTRRSRPSSARRRQDQGRDADVGDGDVAKFLQTLQEAVRHDRHGQTEADEFWKIYNLEVISIPTNKPMSRINHPDMIYRTEKEKWKAAVEEVVEVHKPAGRS